MSSSRILVGLVGFLSVIALCIILHWTANIVIPLVIAWFLVQIFKPVMAVAERCRLPQIVIISLVFVIIFILCGAAILFCISQVREAEVVFSNYSEKLIEFSNQIFDFFQVPSESLTIVNLLRRYLGNISGGVVNFSSQFVLTLIFLMFILLETPGFDRKIETAFPGTNSERIKLVLQSISEQVSRYLGVMALISFITGFCVWVALSLLKIELAAGWAIITFLLNFIPNIGSIIATVPPVLMAMLQDSPIGPLPIVTLIVLGAIQMVCGNIVTPKLLGSRLGISPVVVMLFLLLWSMILGIPGAIMSVPIASIIKIVCENVPYLKPIAVVMGPDPGVASLPIAKKVGKAQ